MDRKEKTFTHQRKRKKKISDDTEPYPALWFILFNLNFVSFSCSMSHGCIVPSMWFVFVTLLA